MTIAYWQVEGIGAKPYQPEGPFGESHGHVALEDFNMSMTVTAITYKKNAVFTTILSEVTPSESSILKKSAYEALYFAHLKKDRKSTRLNSSHTDISRMPSSA